MMTASLDSLRAGPNHIQVRDARDRIIDLLGIGGTYPLRDLPVRDGQLTVAFNTTAKIPIDYSQVGVLYVLYNLDAPAQRTESWDEGPGAAIAERGHGGTIYLETYKIQDDVTFDIRARKLNSGKEAVLLETATVKVGLDASLPAWIRNAPHLDPELDASPENATDTAPRIISYGEAVEVVLENSQEGVDYKLVYFENAEEVPLSVAELRGDLHDIVLGTHPVHEDIDIRIRATKTFDPSDNRATQTALLDVVLPLKVRAYTALHVSVDPSPIVDFSQAPAIIISGTQRSVRYQLFIRRIPDRDFIHNQDTDIDVVRVSVEGEPDAQVRRPMGGGEVWQTPPGYAEFGDFQQGTGVDIRFDLGPMADDSLLIVQAWKDHQDSPARSSAMRLAQTAVVLVRPNPVLPLQLKVLVEGTETDGRMQVFDGQPGVFYHFRSTADGDDLGLPAYFPQRDESDASLNKGLGQLKVDVDYVIARPLDTVEGSVELAEEPPETPVLETGRLPAEIVLHVLAVKAQTRIGAPLEGTAYIPALPEIRVQEPIVDYGGSTRILVLASHLGDRYQALRNGSLFKRARNGNGDDIAFLTDQVSEDIEFDMLVTRTGDSNIAVARLVRLRLLVRPNPGLTVTPVNAVVDHNTVVQIRVEYSQTGVSYRLVTGGEPVGDSVPGTGEAIILPVGPLTKSAIFAVRAAKASDPEISVELVQQAGIEVGPPPASLL